MGVRMILRALALALGQVGDRAFRGVLLTSLVLSLGLLVLLYVAFVGAIQFVTPESFTLPWLGEITFADELLSGLAVAGLTFASTFLMIPVAGAFVGLFLDRIAGAVEARHYPDLPPARTVPLIEAAVDALRFLGIFLLANAIALVVYLVATVAAPFVFWAVNGWLLGVEYFQTVAIRRLPEREARALRRRNRLTVWLLGAVLAVGLSVPVLNLLVPLVGVAAFTHLYHGLAARDGRSPVAG